VVHNDPVPLPSVAIGEAQRMAAASGGVFVRRWDIMLAFSGSMTGTVSGLSGTGGCGTCGWGLPVFVQKEIEEWRAIGVTPDVF